MGDNLGKLHPYSSHSNLKADQALGESFLCRYCFVFISFRGRLYESCKLQELSEIYRFYLIPRLSCLPTPFRKDWFDSDEIATEQ